MTPTELRTRNYPGGITIIGTGRLGTSLAMQFYRKGYVIHSLYNRSSASREKLAECIDSSLITGSFPGSRTDFGGLVFLCLPDDQIADYAGRVAQKFTGLSGSAWIHTSGALPAEVLQPLADAGAGIASFHPVQTFTANIRESIFNDCFVTIQGDTALCNDLKSVVRALGGRPLLVDRQQKTAVHLAAVFVCNYMAPLFSASQHILSENGVELRARELFGPIVRETMEGLLNHSPEEVLTGPVVRGDSGTVDQHLDFLTQSPTWRRLYRELGSVTLQIAGEITGRDGSSDDLLAEMFRMDDSGDRQQ